MAQTSWQRASKSLQRFGLGSGPRVLRGWVVAAALLAGFAVGGLAIAQEEAPPKAAVKGRVTGGELLMNPVWNEARDPNNHRYTFRAPSVTVNQKAKQLSAFLPKEVPIVVIGDGAKAASAAYEIQVSGGRTTPVTVVVPPGQSVQFVNRDPFRHTIYTKDTKQGGLPAEPMEKGKSRTWTPPGPGVYEIRDELFPSVRSWIVVDPKAVASGYPDLKGEFQVGDIPLGTYKLQAYFNGKPTGAPLDIEVRQFPELQQLSDPVVVAEKKKK